MVAKRYVVMGAGEVGLYLARTLSDEGHAVTVVDTDPAKGRRIENSLDVRFVLGNGAQVPPLEAAEVEGCEVFFATSSSDEANLAAALLAKRLGAPRCVVRVQSSDDVTRYAHIYERAFGADLLLSTQLLATTRILNHVLGYNTLEIQYLAGGALQLRRTQVEAGSVLAERRIAEAELPKDCLVLAFISDGHVSVPTGASRAQVGDDALVIGTTEAIDEVEQRVSRHSRRLGLVVVAGGGTTAQAVIDGLQEQATHLKVIESDRARAEELAARYPQHDVVHGDAADPSVLSSESVGDAHNFIALTGHDDTNLMACLLAQELGARRLTALVQKSETSNLWRKVALLDVVSPRSVALDSIRSYLDSGYEPQMFSFENGAAQFVQRRVHEQSPAAGTRMADVEVPDGLIVAAIVHDGRARVARGEHRIEAGDDVILFVRREELDMVQLLFPGPEPD